MSSPNPEQALDELAQALGVTREYHDGRGRPRRACDEAVIAVLSSLGAGIDRIDDAPDALRRHRDAGAARRGPGPVVVAATGAPVELGSGVAEASVTLEDGSSVELHGDGTTGAFRPAMDAGDLPTGLHRLDGHGEAGAFRCLLVVPPPRLPAAPRCLALFAPLYGIRREVGAGRERFATYRDLADLASWLRAGRGRGVSGRDEALVGTLPLLACFLEEPFEPSPYSPISRRFWSEAYVDAGEGGAVAPALRGAGEAARVDYRGAVAVRRRALEKRLASDGRERARVEAALSADDELSAYAAFRAAVEHYGKPWHQWPVAARAGRLTAGVDFDPDVQRYHALAQLLARAQVAEAAAASGGLYLDLPLGSHGGGYDTWRHAASFARGVGVGAPPDAVFEGGQDWSFPPLHPLRSREQGHCVWSAVLRFHCEHAALLRVDHVMGLHRQFWIADGFTPADGVYVRMPAAEMWAVLAVEAARGRGGLGTAVVGEDLGTVPDEVRDAMRSRGALRMHVVPFELRPGHDVPVASPPEDCLACLGTHDMEPFAAWWRADTTDREDLSRLAGCAADDARGALGGLLSWLGASGATVACASLEDLWLETRRQNQPGQPTGDLNWQRPFTPSLDQVFRDAGVAGLLGRLRGEAPGQDAGASAASATGPALATGAPR